MAERRMFARAVINSARFLRMPQTSRLLYYDLGMAADDDGVVEAFTVLRTTGAAEDDLRVLASRGFVTVLNEDLVSVITDWRRNNYIQGDRYHPSIYKALLVKLADGGLDTVCIQAVSNVDTQVSSGELRSGEEKEAKAAGKPPRASRFTPPSLEEVKAFCEQDGLSIDTGRFIDYYAAQGWKLSNGNLMKDWQATARNWARRDGGKQRGGMPSDDEYKLGW